MSSIEDRGPGPYGTLETDELRMPSALFASILSKVESGPNRCIVWTGAKCNGYGLINVAKRTGSGKSPSVLRRVHRVVWELLHGPIPGALTIDHRCRNRACCNILHLDVVTQATNNLRAPKWGLAVTHCPYGHEYTPANTLTNIKKSGSKMRSCKACHRARMRAVGAAGRAAMKARKL